MKNKKPFSTLTTLQEVREYLCKNPLSRRAFCQYSSIAGLEGMVRSLKLHLSKGTKMNDLLECEKIDKEKWERTYIASFTHTFLESIAMWCVYSRQLSETIRLQFLPSRIWKLIENGKKTPIYKVTTTSGDNIVQYDPIGTPEDIKLCDVSYLRQHSLALDEKRLSEIKCKEIKNILSDCSMLGMVKHSAWEYEKETRLCIVLPPNSEQRYPDKIAIDFDGIHGATVMGSPCIDPERIQETLDGLKQEFIGVNKQKQIINSIQFDVADTKHCVSALKDKLYLPTFCSFCTKQSKCNLYKTINR